VTPDDLVTLADILDQPLDTQLTQTERISLARTLVMVVVTLVSTPWLPKAWTLKDLSFFRQGLELQPSLKTLHLSVQLGSRLDDRLAKTGESGLSSLNSHSDNRETHGKVGPEETILRGLGRALLQIDCWTTEIIEPGNPRQVPMPRSTIGVGYRRIAERCFQGSLGCNPRDLDDNYLQDGLLQAADDLEKMIETVKELSLAT
jgi:hypothetical protein